MCLDIVHTFLLFSNITLIYTNITFISKCKFMNIYMDDGLLNIIFIEFTVN
ncbi:MAG: hypothetical protein JG782_1596 [Anaerophaga sp.]|nr:hypothetical protein [Anaerophaga sp.]MDI3521366.1 hypothetical protein [Anaerophaga sp.]